MLSLYCGKKAIDHFEFRKVVKCHSVNFDAHFTRQLPNFQISITYNSSPIFFLYPVSGIWNPVSARVLTYRELSKLFLMIMPDSI